MEQGKVSAALRCIGSQETSLLDVTPDVMKQLKSKHPESANVDDSCLFRGPLPKKMAEEVIYEAIDSQAIATAAKKVSGAAGPSGSDSDLWARMLLSKQFKSKPANLCSALSELARKLNTKAVEPSYLRGFIAGRLVPLDKNPGVRPIAIGEVARRIVCKATMTLVNPDLVEATAPLQTCGGLPGGIEASIHAMRQIFEDPSTEAVLLIDASNAFNALNRAAALHNIRYTCPSMATFITNIYSGQAELFVANSDETVYSKEGTTQGGPESMGFYAASTVSLCTPSVGDEGASKKIFYADDGSAGGSLDSLLAYWGDIKARGPPIGYFPEPKKTWLIVKPEHKERAELMFSDIKITSVGREFLGSYIGTPEGAASFVTEKIKDWAKDVDALVEIAKTEPQLAYSAYVFGTSKRWKFVCRTTPNISEHMQELEQLIREKLIPSIIGGRYISNEYRNIFALPTRHGGMGMENPVDVSDFEYQNSLLMTKQLTDTIYNQCHSLQLEEDVQEAAKKELATRKSDWYKRLQDQSFAELSADERKVIALASEKGASIWLNSLPLKTHGFRLNKQQFVDAICMRYNFSLKDVPRNCACGSAYSINHCLTCRRGGFTNFRHNAVRDTIYNLAQDLYPDVQLEPGLLPVTGEDLPVSATTADGARADVSVLGFWQPLSRAFFDVMVLNPFAQTNWSKEIKTMYSSAEAVKKRKYNERILQVDKGTFTPLVFSCSGGMATEASKMLKHLALRSSVKKQERYSETMSFIRRRVRFDILRTCVISLRGERSRELEGDDVGDLELGMVKLGDVNI